VAIEDDLGPAADGAAAQRVERGAQRGDRHDGVGINEDQRVARGNRRAGVASARNLAEPNRYDPRTLRASHLRGAVGRSIVDDDQLVRLTGLARGGVKRLERRSQESFLVVGGNDERNHTSGYTFLVLRENQERPRSHGRTIGKP